MNRRSWMIISAAIILVVIAGGYTFFRSYVGNNVQISSVIPAEAAAAAGSGDNQTAAGSGQAVSSDAINGQWSITDGSKVYLSVTTSQETVNFVNEKVSGDWTVALDKPEAMTGSGKIDMNANDSGNSMRDNHVRSEEFLDADKYPEAAFAVKSFDGLKDQWTEGEPVPFKMTGTLTVKGIEKEVSFDAKAVYQDGKLLLSGTTVVTFADFGMTNPHTVLLDTQNDIQVQLELILTKA